MLDKYSFKSSGLIIKIWLLHYTIYYWLFGLIFHTIDFSFKKWHFNLNYLEKILLSPIVGVIGFYDGLIIFIPIIISHFMKIKFNVFKSYYYTILLCQFGFYFASILFSDRTSTINFTRNIDDERLNINYIFVITPCLVISILINWLVFKKTYNNLDNPESSDMSK